ncbi:hypothetical protein B932_3308 [Gluconobacter oxydans H24]|nr:hypothetical protein B932_3308 [Gluconobacter oxydans H24]
MVVGKTFEGVSHFLPFQMGNLPRLLHRFRIVRFHEGNQTPQTPPMADIEVMGDGEQPGPQVRSATHLMHPGQGTFQTVLHQIVGLMRVAGQHAGIPSQGRYGVLQPAVITVVQSCPCLIWFPVSLLMKTLLASVYSRPNRATAKYFATHAVRRE